LASMMECLPPVGCFRFSQVLIKLSQLLSAIPLYQSTPEIRTDCSEKDKFRIVEELKDHFKEKYETIEVDGIRILFEDGWALIRASNTQPIIVLRFEAKTKERMEEIKR